jgi:hypothetical protein
VTRPTRPARLGAAGRRLWATLTDAYEFTPTELAVLAAACRQADDVALVEKVIADDGPVVPGSTGQPRLSAALAEARQGRLALGKLLAQLAVPDVADDRPLTARQRNARKAAQTRWRDRGPATA